mmetsp:Transcript_94039/g.237015  ORF Transcript_94039/g.237015 Transcript_94039/m.237015 type:complete len:277 (+) Transcript_94039:495-1325(+)
MVEDASLQKGIRLIFTNPTLLALGLCASTHLGRAIRECPLLGLRCVSIALREKQVLLGYPQVHATLDEVCRVIGGVAIEVPTMPILSALLRSHGDDEIQVLCPTVHSQPHPQRQLQLKTMDGPMSLRLVDWLGQLTIACCDEARHVPVRGEIPQDGQAVPRDLAIHGLDDQRVALQEWATERHSASGGPAILRPLGRPIPALNSDQQARHDPEVAVPEDVHHGVARAVICLGAVKDVCMRVAPEHAVAFWGVRLQLELRLHSEVGEEGLPLCEEEV